METKHQIFNQTLSVIFQQETQFPVVLISLLSILWRNPQQKGNASLQACDEILSIQEILE